MRTRLPPLAGLVLTVVGLAAVGGPAVAPAAALRLPVQAPTTVAGDTEVQRRWVWPTASPRVTQPYRAPAHAYGPGHRGIDLQAAVGETVVAPDDGVVAFAGRVGERTLVTIDHGDGLVSTLEPVETDVVAGMTVRRGEPVGVVTIGGHTHPGDVHLGARQGGAYVNPLIFLSAPPRAVLLPCCGELQDPG